MLEADKKRFESNFKVTPGCWIWLRKPGSHGYGYMSVQGSPQLTHRLAYELYVGELEKHLYVRHKCDNPLCVNPDHLETGTAKDNTQDALTRGRMLIGTLNGMAVLTPQLVVQIRDLAGCGLFTQARIAYLYGIRRPAVSKIHLGNRWKSVQ